MSNNRESMSNKLGVMLVNNHEVMMKSMQNYVFNELPWNNDEKMRIFD